MKVTIYMYGKFELKKLFAEHGLHMGEVAEKVGVSRPTIHKLMNGKGCSSAVAKKICDAFEVNIWDYFRLEDEK